MKQIRAAVVWTVEAMLDSIYPCRCQACHARVQDGVLCAACRSAIQPLPPDLCETCGGSTDGSSVRCTRCRVVGSPVNHSHAVGAYEGALREAIHRMKYAGRTALARPLGTMLAEAVLAGGSAPPADAIVPVPLHWWRARMRGFNQSQLLAEAASERLEVPVARRALRRVRYTPPQVQLASADREVNMQGAFAAGDLTAVRGKHLLLVDDVMTTMATVTECARVLRAAGAEAVTVASVARATRS